MLNHHIKANNPEVTNYDPNKPRSYITYLDVKNLYGWALKQNVPTHNLQWIDMWDYGKIIDEILGRLEENGCILEVNLTFPDYLHDEQYEFPLAPERMNILKFN